MNNGFVVGDASGIFDRINTVLTNATQSITTIGTTGKTLLAAVAVVVFVLSLFFILFTFWKRRKPEGKQQHKLGGVFILALVALAFSTVTLIGTIQSGGSGVSKDIVTTITGE
ncbi:hypothetical protein [Pseudolactococcus insecticola]|uniref:Uncharacterized protein n=1 Tax=Pseudolactococcus insecticola TaxID=2709158 RepID=A0A6A0B7I9_9LACT|nr:hypothetical protein [Lactococcus insecticola]GFH41270.1 hypothetical protein Hs20B_16680 [Lactococcus insecticola]